MNPITVSYRHILVALDGSETAEEVLPHVEALALAFRAKVTLIVASESPEMVIASTIPVVAHEEPALVIDPTAIVNQEHREARAYLASTTARLTALGIAASFEQLEGPPAETILTTARRLPADLIAMTTHGRGGLGRLVFGSVADEVLRHTSCPMLLVRVDEEEEEVVRAAEPARVAEPDAAQLVPLA